MINSYYLLNSIYSHTHTRIQKMHTIVFVVFGHQINADLILIKYLYTCLRHKSQHHQLFEK